MNKSLNLVLAILLTLVVSQVIYCQEIRTVDRQVKVYIYAPNSGEIEKAFVERLTERLQERGEMKVIKSTRGYDYIVSIIADVIPDFDMNIRNPDEIPPPDTFVVSTVIISRDLKETYKKQNLQASRDMDQIVNRIHALMRKIVEEK
jgi:hypothetical protein